MFNIDENQYVDHKKHYVDHLERLTL